MRVILIAIGMHTNLCIVSLAFIACNWELLRLNIDTTESFYCLEHSSTIN